MFTWKEIYVEEQRRQEKTNYAVEQRRIQAAIENCETPVTKLSIRMLDAVGKQLVQWGSQLQCRCAELTMESSKRAI